MQKSFQYIRTKGTSFVFRKIFNISSKGTLKILEGVLTCEFNRSDMKSMIPKQFRIDYRSPALKSYGQCTLGMAAVFCIFTTRIRRMGKVLFSQVCVCPQGMGEGVPIVSGLRSFPRGGGTLVSGPRSQVLFGGGRYPVLVLARGGGVPCPGPGWGREREVDRRGYPSNIDLFPHKGESEGSIPRKQGSGLNDGKHHQKFENVYQCSHKTFKIKHTSSLFLDGLPTGFLEMTRDLR